MTLEKNLERRCRDYAKGMGWAFLKFGQYGWPDRLLVTDKADIWMELKSGSSLSKLQRKRIDHLRSLGANVYVIESFENFLRAIEGSYSSRGARIRSAVLGPRVR